MTDKQFNRKQSFAFLQDVKKSLLDYYSQRDIQAAQTFGLKTFGETISDKIVIFLAGLNPLGILQQQPCWLQRQN